MKKYLLLLSGFAIIALIVAGCAEAPREEEEKEKKKEVEIEELEAAKEFSEDAFVEIYAQTIYLSEKFMSEDFGDDVDAYTEALEKFSAEIQDVYDEYNVDEETFTEWNHYLEEKPEKMHQVLNRAGERLEELRNEQ